MKNKIRLTYVSDKHYCQLDYLVKLCPEIDMTKIDILRIAMDRMFSRVEPYKSLLKSDKFLSFKQEFEKALTKENKISSKN